MAAATEHVAVVVLGDVGRSPRMQYHCTSLAGLPSTQVHLVGYGGERCIADVESNPRISQHLINNPFAKWSRKWFLLYAPIKVLYQLWMLFYILLIAMPKPKAILVQNPPSIPALLAVWLACRLRGAKMIIDWHNFGYTVLGLSLGKSHPLVEVSRRYEAWFAKRGDGHLCVTEAMRDWLKANWGIKATVLYDRAPPFFRPTTVDEQHALFTRLASQLPPATLAPTGARRSVSSTARSRTGSFGGNTSSVSGAPATPAGASSTAASSTATPLPVGSAARKRKEAEHVRGSDPVTPQPVAERTLCTEVVGGVVAKRADRPAVIISSTSWTEDEDFGILLDALISLDAAASAKPDDFPDFLVIVTGKGPQRAMYEQRISELKLRRVQIRTMWLAASDYPLLLGSADLGVCLHFSTSGLDLPMKVVDMFGCGLPVCAVQFNCLHELVKNNFNGLTFTGSVQLADQLRKLFTGFPGNPSQAELSRLRKGVEAFQSVRWQDNWNANAAQYFR